MLAVIAGLFSSGALAAEPPTDKELNAFLGRLQSGNDINWDDYHISQHLSPTRREIIHNKMRSEIKGRLRSDYTIKILEKREIQDVSAVLIATTYEANPLFVEVTGLTFCRVEEAWKATPLMGQFDYSGYKLYQQDAEDRQQSLEDWVYKRSEHYREELTRKLRGELAYKVAEYSKSSALRGEAADKAVMYFLDMCKRGDLCGIVAALGIEVEKLDQRGSQQFYSVLDGLNGVPHESVWQKLKDYSYIAAPMKPLDAGGGIVSMAMYFPEDKTRSQIMEFPISKQKGRWVVGLPEDMTLDEDGEFPDSDFRAWKLQRENRDRLDEVPQTIVEALDDFQEDQMNAVIDRLTVAMRSGDLPAWLSLYQLKDCKDDELEEALSDAASEWVVVRSGGRNAFEVLAQDTLKDVGAVKLLAYSKDKPSNYNIQRIWLVKNGKSGWRLVSAKAFKKDTLKDLREYRDKLKDASQDDGSSKALSILVGDSKVKDPKQLTPMGDVNEEKLKNQYNKYNNALEKSDYQACLKVACSFKGAELQLLDAITADMHGHNDSDSRYELIGAHLSEHLGGVTIKRTNGRSSDSEYLLYVLLRVDDSIFVAPSVLYRYEQHRGDKLLNGKLFSQAKDWGSEDLKKSIDVLIKKHNQCVKEILEQKK